MTGLGASRFNPVNHFPRLISPEIKLRIPNDSMREDLEMKVQIAYRGVMKLSMVMACMLMLVATCAPSSKAQGARIVLNGPTVVSGAELLPPANAPGWCGSDAAHQDWEEESTIAVNPTNSNNLVVAWIQDWSDAIVTGYSMDGGNTWKNVVAPSSKCTGGPDTYDGYSVIDPSLSFGPDGTLYLTSTLKAGTSNAIVNVSRDGGKSWSQPIVVATQGTWPTSDYIERSIVVADPFRAGNAYLVWNHGTTDNALTPRFSRTTDGGKSWTKEISIFDSAGYSLPLGQGTLISQMLFVRGDKRIGRRDELVYVFMEFDVAQDPFFSHGPSSLLAMRSDDYGSSWSGPSVVANPAALGFITGANGGVSPDGSTIYLAWQTSRYPACIPGDDTCNSLMFSKSIDGGQSWSAVAPIASSAGSPMFAGNNILLGPNIAVAPDGTVGVMFYDHRNNKLVDNPDIWAHTTDLWFRYSQNGGLTWSDDLHLAGPFDEQSVPDGRTTPPPENGFLGDYQGMAPAPEGFALSYVLAQPEAATAPSDIFFSRVRVKH